MDTKTLPDDFKELLKLLNEHHVDYLVIGGYAVGFHGYIRTTGDMDIWVRASQENAANLHLALTRFGFSPSSFADELSLTEKTLIRFGVRPMQVEILTTILGVTFDECYQKKSTEVIDGVAVSFINLDDLTTNKLATGRLKDLTDIDMLQKLERKRKK
jgi:predicted nucleotidyltransferase